MKKWIGVVIVSVAVVIGVAACDSEQGGAANSSVGSQKEESQKEESQKEENQKEENGKTDTTVEEKQEEAQKENPEKDTLEENDSTQEQDTDIKTAIYYGNANADGFEKEEISLNSLSPEGLMERLIEKGVLAPDVGLVSFSETTVDGSKAIDLDLSKSFEEFIGTKGTSGEYLAIGSLCNTFLEAYDCEKIRITIEGSEFATGHAEYPGYMTFFN